MCLGIGLFAWGIESNAYLSRYKPEYHGTQHKPGIW